MKHFFACLILALLMGFALVGCASSSGPPATQSTPSSAASSTPSASESGAPSQSATPAHDAAPQPTDQGAGVATLEKLDKIKVGMTYDEVAKVMGGPGKKLGEATVSGVHGVTYAWYGTELATGIVVQFIDGTVKTKAQTGLK
jgi:cytoskeletal protein RodZ